MGLFHFLIVLQGLIAAALVGFILMQRSEGGGLGMGGSPSGLMSARGAADFMTRATAILASLFVLLSIALAFVAARQGGSSGVDESFERREIAPAISTPQPAAAEQAAVEGAAANGAATTGNDEIPLDK